MKSYKGRSLDRTKPVRVYRNLHRGGYSIKQKGLVVAHCDSVSLHNCRLVVNEDGRRRVVADKRKGVHAFVIGYVQDVMRGIYVSYNPYTQKFFQSEGVDVHEAEDVILCARDKS